MENKIRKIILEDGSQYLGYGFGSDQEKMLELVFNTSMVGYQEILSDPSYTDQAVVMTYPIIGNYGINEEDYETKVPSIGALLVREYTKDPSNFRSKECLSDFMERYGIVGVAGLDTREITRKIRKKGSCKVLITGQDCSLEEGKRKLADWDYRHDQVSRVSSKKQWTAESTEQSCHVVAIDCGMKLNIVRSLHECGCKVTVLPWNVDVKTIQDLKPDGIFLSNGPGDPTDLPETIDTIRQLHGQYPIFGICLGHQLLALSYGAKTYKLKFGHRGGNHPVKNLLTDHIEITSQNHSYAVAEDSLQGLDLQVTHINMLDHTVEGLQCERDLAFSVQYHPESAPGPQDSRYLFSRFVDFMKGGKCHA